MGIPKRYVPDAAERKWQRFWEENATYHFAVEDNRPVYAIDTPPL